MSNIFPKMTAPRDFYIDSLLCKFEGIANRMLSIPTFYPTTKFICLKFPENLTPKINRDLLVDIDKGCYSVNRHLKLVVKNVKTLLISEQLKNN